MKLKLLILCLFPIMLLGQANLTYVRSHDSTFSIVNQNSPFDTLLKITKNGRVIKYISNLPADTLTTFNEVRVLLNETSDNIQIFDLSGVFISKFSTFGGNGRGLDVSGYNIYAGDTFLDNVQIYK